MVNGLRGVYFLQPTLPGFTLLFKSLLKYLGRRGTDTVNGGQGRAHVRHLPGRKGGKCVRATGRRLPAWCLHTRAKIRKPSHPRALSYASAPAQPPPWWYVQMELAAKATPQGI